MVLGETERTLYQSPLESEILDFAAECEKDLGVDVYEHSPFIRLVGILEEMYDKLDKGDHIEILGVSIEKGDITDHFSKILDIVFELTGSDVAYLYKRNNNMNFLEVGTVKLKKEYENESNIELLNTPIEAILGRLEYFLYGCTEEGIKRANLTPELANNYRNLRTLIPLLKQIIFENFDELRSLTMLKNSFDSADNIL